MSAKIFDFVVDIREKYLELGISEESLPSYEDIILDALTSELLLLIRIVGSKKADRERVRKSIVSLQK